MMDLKFHLRWVEIEDEVTKDTVLLTGTTRNVPTPRGYEMLGLARSRVQAINLMPLSVFESLIAKGCPKIGWHIPEMYDGNFPVMMYRKNDGSVFMDGLLGIRSSFSTMPKPHLEKLLKRCEDTNLALNWEKSHFHG
ncbi:hypothetical protein Tco_0089353 [Tanacetum coccineum]